MADPYSEVDTLPPAEQDVLRPILNMILEAGLREKVDFLDIRSQAELASTYRYFARRKSVFILTAFYEPFGLAPIEAAACGLACVATKNGGPSEIFSDGSGILVDPFNSEDIAFGMQRALQEYPELSKKAAQRVRVKYTWEQTAAGYLSAIEQGLKTLVPERLEVPKLDASEIISEYLD